MPKVAALSHSTNCGRSPRPILRQDLPPLQSPILPFSHSYGALISPHVHFPPTPGMSSTFPAHSPSTYDRKPILVSPNVVQLPRRGDRRMQTPYAEGDWEHRGRSRSRSRERGLIGNTNTVVPVKGSYFHPRAFEACMPEPSNVPAPPQVFAMPALVHDLSPSDESDEAISTPPNDESLSRLAPATISLPLRLPESPKARRHSSAVGHAPKTLSPRSSVSSQSSSREGNDSPVRSARMGRGRQRTVFSPDRDEGCLGGF